MKRFLLKTLCLVLLGSPCCSTIEALTSPAGLEISPLVPKWHKLIGRRGEKGRRGNRGKKGERGNRGHRGHRGIRGSQGLPGSTGSTGTTGPAGAIGAAGADPTNLNRSFINASLSVTGPTLTAPLPYIVPLNSVGPSNGATFAASTFVVENDGDYFIDYFLQILYPAVASPMSGPPATMSLVFSGPSAPFTVGCEMTPTNIFGTPWTTPSGTTFPYVAVSTGTQQLLRHLTAGTTIQLQILTLPAGMSGYLDGYDDSDTRIEASVALHQVD